MLLSEFADIIENTADPDKPLVFINREEQAYGARCAAISGDVVESGLLRKKLMISFKPKGGGIRLYRDDLVAFLRSLEQRYSKRCRITILLYVCDSSLLYVNGQPLVRRFEGQPARFREMFKDGLWGGVDYRGDNLYYLYNGGCAATATPDYWKEYNSSYC